MNKGRQTPEPDGGSAVPYQLEWEREALKRLKRLPRDRQQQIRAKFKALAAGPAGPQPQAKPVKGRPGVFRLRVGDWRGAYRLDHAQRLVTVLEIEPGHDVY